MNIKNHNSGNQFGRDMATHSARIPVDQRDPRNEDLLSDIIRKSDVG